MKIHITNLYNFSSGDKLVKKQHRFAEAGRALGFLEMGIFAYPVETDTPSELSKRLDGIIAALESEDVVFLQLPTENGYEYERLLLNKLKAYSNTKIILILHDMHFLSDTVESELQAKYLDLYKMADAVIIPMACEKERIKKYGLSNLLIGDNIQLADSIPLHHIGNGGFISLCQSDFYIRKTLMDAIESVFAMQSELYRMASGEAEEIHIGFGLHDKTGNYSTWVGTAMQSIIEHTSVPICFHILHDETLDGKNQNNLIQVALGGGKNIQFHLLEKTLFSEISKQMGAYTIGAMFRIMLPEILPELSRIIYLDADILVNCDVKELWETDIHNYCMAAVPDMEVINGPVVPIPVKRNEVPRERYFNSGVLYMNLSRIREKGNMRQEIMDYLEKTKESDLPDQDALNVIYGAETLLLDGRWNYFTKVARRNGEKKLESKIYHYVGTPCLLYYLTEIDQLYYETTSRTPWGQETCRRLLMKSLERVSDRMGQLEKVLMQISCPDKKRIFYGKETLAMKNLYQLLSIREEDYRILAEPIEEYNSILPCKDFSALVEEKDSFVIFVLPEADDGSSITRLEQLGLENGKDFFVIPRLFFPHQGGYV